MKHIKSFIINIFSIVYGFFKQYVINPVKFVFTKYIIKPIHQYVLIPIYKYVIKLIKIAILKVVKMVKNYILLPVRKFVLIPIYKYVLYPVYKVLIRPILRIIMNFMKKHAGYLFLTPWLLGFLIFTGLPFLFTFYLSFTNVKQTGLGWDVQWNNFSNYYNIFFKSTNFVPALINFFIMQILYVPVILVISFILGLLLNQEIKGRAIFRTIFFLPVIILSGSVMQQFADTGVNNFSSINNIFIFKIINNYSPFIANGILILFVNFTTVLWFTGIPIILFINALQKIDRQLYEASQIDGANWWQILWKITMPMIKSTALVVSVYTVVNLGLYNLNPRQNGIPSVYDLIRGALDDTAKGLGLASAYASLYSVIVFILVILAMFILKDRYKVKNIESLQERQRKNLYRIQQKNRKSEMSVKEYFKTLRKKGDERNG